jgi:hypothetical protein
MKPSWIDLTGDQRDELHHLVEPPGWRLVTPEALPSAIPYSLREKIGVALMIGTPTSTGGTYLVFSAHRVDYRARAIDIEPFGAIVHSTGPGPSGVFVHHGSWADRTRAAPAGFWEEIKRSGVDNYFLANPPNGLTSGTLAQLPNGDRGAFDAIVRQIRSREDAK